jgi:hypothetical protein
MKDTDVPDDNALTDKVEFNLNMLSRAWRGRRCRAWRGVGWGTRATCGPGVDVDVGVVLGAS